MDIEILPGAYALATIKLNRDDVFFSEPGAMVAMSLGIDYQPRVDDNIVSASLRNILGGESFFFSRAKAQISNAWISIAPKFPGDIAELNLNNYDIINIQSGSYLGHSEGVDIDVKLSKPGEFLLREGATILQASSNGKLLISSYGQLQQYTLQLGQSLIVDTGHLVAWSENLKLDIGALTGVISAQFLGEGLVGKFTAVDRPGYIVIQTRSEQNLSSWLNIDRAHN
jgi:uncharacterized protein (TIGR00266 family)